MKVKCLILNLLYISIVFFCFIGCKKYKTTTVHGKVSNLAIGKGIPDALVVLTAYQVGKKELPDKAKIELQTRTDSEGNYSFNFEAYVPNNEKEAASYGVEYLTEGKFIDWFSGEGSGSTVNLIEYFNDDLLTFSHVDNPGKDNKIDINVVLNGRIYFQFYNDLPIPNTHDTLYVRAKNKFTEYRLTGTNNIDQTQNNLFLIQEPFSLTTGDNTISYYITKNGIKTRIDTTIFVEPKDYHINFHY